jgi:hypothetical protein
MNAQIRLHAICVVYWRVWGYQLCSPAHALLVQGIEAVIVMQLCPGDCCIALNAAGSPRSHRSHVSSTTSVSQGSATPKAPTSSCEGCFDVKTCWLQNIAGILIASAFHVRVP